MTETVVQFEDEVEAAADAVWPYFDWPNLERMLAGGFFRSVVYRDRTPIAGARRTIETDIGRLEEELVACDVRDRTLRYRILDPAPLPLASYRGTVIVEPIGAQRCRVRFESACELSGLDASAWRTHYCEMQRAHLAYIRGAVSPR